MTLKTQKFGTFPFPGNYKVLKKIMLNKTDLRSNNNKFYKLELHEGDGGAYRVYSCYGRVGDPGREEERIPEQNLIAAEVAYEEVLRQKTSARKGYKPIDMAQDKIGSFEARKIVVLDVDTDKVKVNGEQKKKAKISNEVQLLVTQIYDEAGRAVSNQLSGSLQASADNPLGTLTKSQIAKGSNILEDIRKRLNKNSLLLNSMDSDLIDLTNEYFTQIPQNFGRYPKIEDVILNDFARITFQDDLLELLGDVQGTADGFKAGDDIQAKYDAIGCKITLLSSGSKKYKQIVDYIHRTESHHHSVSVDIRSIFKIDIKGCKSRFENKCSQMARANVKELFHGSRNANILGILSHGLLMRPPGVVVTGSMFGAGLYFADQSTKSTQYSVDKFGGRANKGDNAFLFLADVALGKVKKMDYADWSLTKAAVQREGYDSVKGCKGPSLLHNEFIIYDIGQHMLTYVVDFEPIRKRKWF